MTELSRLILRFRGSWLPPVSLAATLALVGAARLTVAGNPDPAFARATLLSQVDEAIGLGLWVAVLVAAWLVVHPDNADGFAGLDRRGDGVGAAGFLAARLAVGAGWLGLVTLALGAAAALLTAGAGGAEQALHLLVLAANALPILLLLLAFGTLLNPFVAWLPALVLQQAGYYAAYDRLAVADTLIDNGVLVQGEQALRWICPPPLVDPLLGQMLQLRAQAIDDFPTQQGPGIWGTDLVAVSTSGDVLHWAVYLLAVLAFWYLACRLQAAHVARRLPIAPLPAYDG